MKNEAERASRLAILIDAENVPSRYAAAIFQEVASIGEASARRIYGDFSSDPLKSWTEVLSKHAIIPHQNFPNTAGKNSSDIALIIDAMDLLHSGRFDGFCLVSSDGDFTRLAARIREHGLDVYGFGERKTPESFRRACKRFIYIENLIATADQTAANSQCGGTTSTREVTQNQSPKSAVKHIQLALNQLDDADGWYFLGAVGNRLAALQPDFDPRTFGCPKLVTLIERSEKFDIRRENLKVYIRER